MSIIVNILVFIDNEFTDKQQEILTITQLYPKARHVMKIKTH